MIHGNWIVLRLGGLVVSAGLPLLGLVGCGNHREAAQPVRTETAAPKASAGVPATVSETPSPSSDRFDPCSLLTQAEVEAAVGKRMLAPVREAMANLATCSFGDPEAPKVAGRSLSALRLTVFSGTEGFAGGGPEGQVREAFELARSNSSAPEPVEGLGKEAFWTESLHELSVLQGQYLVEVEVDLETPRTRLEVAKSLATRVLGRLP